MANIAPSELVLNNDGSIYHLNLRQGQVAPTIFLVGDPGRVPNVSKHFDRVDHRVQKREFVTHTGWLGGKHLSVVSTGIGTDNIDIVINELDALFNIDFQTRQVKEELTTLEFIRLGTSGSLYKELEVDSLVVSVYGIGLDNLLSYYGYRGTEKEGQLKDAFTKFSDTLGINIRPCAVGGDPSLLAKLGAGMTKGITLTCPGFYGPQGRSLRLGSTLGPKFFDSVGGFSFENLPIANFEMETSGIFGLAKLLGHRGASCNTILANRLKNEFTKDYGKSVENLIRHVLEKIVS